MRQAALLLIGLGLALQACQPLPAGTAPPGRQFSTTPTSIAVPSTAAWTNIPLQVGRGVDGGWIQLYFTDPSDPAADQLEGGPDLPLVEAIDKAELSVDAAMYSLTLYSVRRALIQANRRGVRVRVVMESDNMDTPDVEAVKDAGIPIIGDRREGLMHNKFIVIDRSEAWTGSMNMTDAGTYRDRNTLIRLRSTEAAEDYEAEFEEMFLHDHFGPDVADPTPYPRLTVDGTKLEIYYSPDDHPEAVLVDLLKSAHKSIYFLAYSFTSNPLAETIQQRAADGVTVAGVMDANQARTNTGSDYDFLRTAGIDVRLDGEDGLMHYKALIIDGQTVVVGSYNFTASAARYNDENLIVFHSPEIAAQYMQEFRRIQAAAEP